MAAPVPSGAWVSEQMREMRYGTIGEIRTMVNRSTFV
jgi:hypothetical protein